MARQNSTLEFNTFIKGLVTEAGPLTFPQDASISEDNWVLLKDGSRRRRMGMNFEPGYSEVVTSQVLPSTGKMAFNTFLWENAGGKPDLQILVIQVGASLTFLDRTDTPITDNILHRATLPGLMADKLFSFSAVDGKLVVATGQKDITIFTMNSSGGIKRTTTRLKIRDLFGVEDVDPVNRDMLSGEYIGLRPTHFSDSHMYNLRNQTWGIPRIKGDSSSNDLSDPLLMFFSASSGITSDGMKLKGSIQIVDGTPMVVSLDGGSSLQFTKFFPRTLNGELMDVLDLKRSTVGIAPTSLDYKGDSSEETIGTNDKYLIWDGEAWSTFDQSLAISVSSEGGLLSWPSNADSTIPFLFPNPNASGGSIHVDRFFPVESANTLPGSSRAPTGHFIIDALDRGISRLNSVRNLYDRFDDLSDEYGLNNITVPADITPGGPTTVESYAGRIWYAGFPGEVISGDKESPSLGSYLLFSQLVKGPTDITRCYQAGDPTSKEEPDLVDTDGGFIKLDGAYGIKKIVSLGRVLIVLASNGVWSIQGGGDYGFTATNYLVNKISDHAIVGPESAVVVDGTLFFWGLDGIYHVSPDEAGYYRSTNMTKNVIQGFYNEITDQAKLDAKGFYDSYDNKVRWLYGNIILDGEDTRELIFDTSLNAFYPSTIKRVSGGLPAPVGLVQVKPYKLQSTTEDVTHNGELVTHNGEPVTYTTERRQNATRESMYLTITGTNPVTFTLSIYNDSNFVDWRSYDGIGVDCPAHLITGYVSGGDFQRYKQVPYITMHFSRTETGFLVDEFGDLYPANPSSCLVQARWEWSNSANSNRWGKEFQAYRYRRFYMPENAADPYDTGFETIVTKNRLRGKGKVLSLFLRTEPGKDCHIHGWSMLIGANANV